MQCRWDVFPVRGDGAVAEECLQVFKEILKIDHAACRESALHGIGHFAIYDQVSSKCKKLADEFLNENKNIDPVLLEYAQNAREGNVL